MYKYVMSINSKPYTAIFADHFSAADFLDENEREGEHFIIDDIIEMNALAVLFDETLERDYRIECAAEILVPDHRKYHKVCELEQALRRLGYLE